MTRSGLGWSGRPGQGDLAAVEVDGEVVSGEAGTFLALPGATGPDRSDELDLVVACGGVE
jgi:hypothetical protein